MAAKKTRRGSKARTSAASAPLDSSPLPIVGIGASAGGLEAFTQVLQELPADLGMAIVLVQHLAPQHESSLPVLLGSISTLPVVQVTERTRVEANHVYVIPPNAQLALQDGELQLSPRASDRTQFLPIDFFFRSLAESAHERAIAVVLSGTASDGAAGIREVKAAGGITIAQLPESAKYDGMPRAAIATGMVDFALRPTEIAAELVRIARHPYVRDAPPAADDATGASAQLAPIFTLLRNASGVDFRHYKLPTILRRMNRRLALLKLAGVSQYVAYLRENPGEIQRLYQDILIHVTRFFREPESFDALRSLVFPELLARRSDESPLRFWVCGCATGEEAYSAAISLLEHLGDEARSVPIQIFATDVSELAIEHARNGVYPESIAADVSPERLRRFFTKTDGMYRISNKVRDLCVFARQDLTRDPPFSRLDLVMCRNVLIYMNAPLQRRLMGVFHYALKPASFLMLGHAETIGSHSDLFSIRDKRSRLYARKASAAPRAGVSFSVEPSPATVLKPRRSGALAHEPGSLLSEANRVVLDRYGPAGVVVDGDLQIVQFRGQTGPYLEPAPGDPNLSLLKMAREGLLYGLRTALHAARERNEPVRREGLRVRHNGRWLDLNLAVVPLSTADRKHYLVLFDPLAQNGAADVAEKPAKKGRTRTGRKAPVRKRGKQTPEAMVLRLQQEVAASRDHLQAIIQELEAANEELQSANEEILSSNEELQSTNEELDTAKEELQSTNEELNTVNEELQSRNDELSRVNSDLVNLLGSVEIAIVIVASDLRIRRFTPMAERVLNLIPADVGRPISHIKPNIDCPQLEQLIGEVVDRVVVREIEVRDRQGHSYSLRIRPYKNVDNRIDGAVLSLFDISATRRDPGSSP